MAHVLSHLPNELHVPLLYSTALDPTLTTSPNGTVSFSNNTYLSGTKKETLDFGALSVFDGGKQLLDNILSIDMSGLTGPIQFGSDRSPLNPSCVILNVIATGYRGIGYWSNYSGLSVITPEKLHPKPANHSISS
ncbi:hypothetical protein JHK85_006067 [Glycine max]|uniref:Glutamate receptor 3.1 n=1 Tax=Glycine soja TaxID=3848 RepID=A0A445LWL1_GLYSO|nr:hypothetical protein JHK85_006067 [Glycine max]RZC27610.1 Glutamate receptor 3.1 [Glycine soja]